jgi:hypothetical protein
MKFFFYYKKIFAQHFMYLYEKDLNQKKFPITIKDSLENNQIDSTVDLQKENVNEILFIAYAKQRKIKLGAYTCKG